MKFAANTILMQICMWVDFFKTAAIAMEMATMLKNLKTQK
jgi:hypothetical protein